MPVPLAPFFEEMCFVLGELAFVMESFFLFHVDDSMSSSLSVSTRSILPTWYSFRLDVPHKDTKAAAVLVVFMGVFLFFDCISCMLFELSDVSVDDSWRGDF